MKNNQTVLMYLRLRIEHIKDIMQRDEIAKFSDFYQYYKGGLHELEKIEELLKNEPNE